MQCKGDLGLRLGLVVPRSVRRRGQYYEFPLGLAYISAVLKASGFNVFCLNLNHVDEPVESAIRNMIIQRDIDVVGTGGLSDDYSKVRGILDCAKRADPDVVTILGGGVISSGPRLVFEAINPAFGVLFEGEATIVELVTALERGIEDFSDIKGLIWRKKSKTVLNSPREPIRDLDSIPFPDYEGFGVDEFLSSQMTNDNHYFFQFDRPRVLPMISSRCCPFDCSFCFHPLGRTYRQRSLENFFEEVEHLIDKFRINMVVVYDELFSMHRQRMMDFCDKMKQYRLRWATQLRVGDHIDEEVLMKMKESGCCVLAYGLESASNRVLKSMGKHISVRQMERTLELTWNHKIGIQGNFIFGDSEESLDTANETLRWWSQHQNYQITLTPIFVYPGTKLYDIALKRKMITDEHSYLTKRYPIVNVTRLSETEYQRLLKRLVALNVENREKYKAQILYHGKIRKDKRKGTIYKLSVRCPHCASVNSYSEFNFDPTRDSESEGCRTACRHCNRRFNIFIPTLSYRLLRLLPPHARDTAASLKKRFISFVERSL